MNTKSTLGVALSSAFIATVTMSQVANAAQNPFAMQTLDKGYQIAEAESSKAKDAKCGASMNAKDKDAKCGAAMHTKDKDAKCGAAMKTKDKDAKCGAAMNTKDAK